jgi:hypothetical protein
MLGVTTPIGLRANLAKRRHSAEYLKNSSVKNGSLGSIAEFPFQWLSPFMSVNQQRQ